MSDQGERVAVAHIFRNGVGSGERGTVLASRVLSISQREVWVVELGVMLSELFRNHSLPDRDFSILVEATPSLMDALADAQAISGVLGMVGIAELSLSSGTIVGWQSLQKPAGVDALCVFINMFFTDDYFTKNNKPPVVKSALTFSMLPSYPQVMSGWSLVDGKMRTVISNTP